MLHPKKLTDLRHMDQVVHLSPSKTVEAEANRWFHELFDPIDPVFIHKLFTEDGKVVYECYQDPGAVDRLFIVQ